MFAVQWDDAWAGAFGYVNDNTIYITYGDKYGAVFNGLNDIYLSSGQAKIFPQPL